MCSIRMLTDEHVEMVMKTNFRDISVVNEILLKGECRGDHFSVVAVSSVSSTAGWAGGTAYCVYKGC